MAALRCWPVTVTLTGREFTIPALPASAWFIAVLGDEVLPIVPGLLGEADQEEVSDLIAFGDLGLEEVVAASRDALEVASGWRWWEADRLIRSAGAEWKVIGGELLRAGADLDRLSLGAVLGLIYALAARNLDPQKRQQLDFQISQPPRELAEQEREALAEEMFAELMAEAGQVR